MSWRDILPPIHPAAEIFPLMWDDTVRALGESIKENGLLNPIVFWRDPDGKTFLLDGRNRLDAMEMVGLVIKFDDEGFIGYEQNDKFIKIAVGQQGDPYELAGALNGPRRHMSPEEKRKTVTRAIKALPERSDRAIARIVGVSPTTVGTVRQEIAGSLSRMDSEPASEPSLRETHSEPVTSNISSEPDPQKRLYRTKHGTVATMNVANIGKSRPPPAALPAEQPAQQPPPPAPPPVRANGHDPGIVSSDRVQAQLDRLRDAWDGACEEARERFLELIGA